MIGIRGAYGCFNQLLVFNGDTENDNNIVTVDSQFQVEYNQIVNAFNNVLCVMVYLKIFPSVKPAINIYVLMQVQLFQLWWIILFKSSWKLYTTNCV